MPSEQMTQLVDEHGGRLKDALARNCLAVRVRASGVTRERTIEEAKVTIDGEPAKDEFQMVAKAKLMPPEIDRELSRVANRARRIPSTYGVQMAGTGLYLIPLGVGDNGPVGRLFRELAEARTEYAAVAEQFADKWIEHVERLKASDPKVYETIKKNLRDRAAFVAAHTVSSNVFPLAGLPDDLEKTLAQVAMEQGLTADQAAVVVGHMKKRVDEYSVTGVASEQLASSWAQEAARLTRATLAETIETMLADPLKEFTEALAKLETTLDKGTVKNSSIAMVRRSYEKLESFKFMLPPELVDRMNTVERELDPTRAAGLRGQANHVAAQGLAEVLKAAREEISKIDGQRASFLGARRVIRLETKEDV